jgi:hypothetical protein
VFRYAGRKSSKCNVYTDINTTLIKSTTVDGWKRGPSTSCPAVPLGAASPHVYPAGCAWWHDFASNTKHFIKNCDIPVPGWECLPAESRCWNQTSALSRFRVAGAEMAAIPIGANYSCDMAPSETSAACHPYMAHLNRSSTGTKTWLFDFGQNFAGLTQIKVKALPKGTRLLVRHAELLSPCGDVEPQQCPVAEPSGDTMFEGGWPCAPTRLGVKDMDQDQGGAQNTFFAPPLYTKHDRFTKTGSGQTLEKLRQKAVFRRQSGQPDDSIHRQWRRCRDLHSVVFVLRFPLRLYLGPASRPHAGHGDPHGAPHQHAGGADEQAALQCQRGRAEQDTERSAVHADVEHS